MKLNSKQHITKKGIIKKNPIKTVKKVWSWNPTLYKTISIKTAQKQYKEYLGYFEKRYNPRPEEKPKTFKEWLKTEI